MTSIDYSAIANFEKILTSVPQRIQEAKDQTLLDAAEFLIEKIREIAPRSNRQEAVQHQHYADSWKIGTKTENSIIVTSPQGTLYLILEIQGRTPGRIYPRNKQVLRFWLGGDVVFAAYVDHPGFPPMPHVGPAMDQLSQKLTTMFYTNLKAKLALFS